MTLITGEYEYKATVGDGKYTVIFDKEGRLYALRYDKPWQDLTGNGLVLAMLQEIDRLKELVGKSEQVVV